MCFYIFRNNPKVQNGRHFWEDENFFEIGKIFYILDTLWAENFEEIALSHTVKEIEAKEIVFLHFWRKFKMAATFGESKFFGKNTNSTLSLWIKNFDEIALSCTV